MFILSRRYFLMSFSEVDGKSRHAVGGIYWEPFNFLKFHSRRGYAKQRTVSNMDAPLD